MAYIDCEDSKEFYNPPTYKKLSKEERNELLVLAQKGDDEAKSKLFLSDYSLIVDTAKNFFAYNTNGNDLLQFAIEGYLKAIYSFDFSKDNMFSTYAVVCIKNNMRRNIQYDKLPLSIPSNLKSFLIQIHTIILEKGENPETMEYIYKKFDYSKNLINRLASLRKPVLFIDEQLKDSHEDNMAIGFELSDDFNLEEYALNNIQKEDIMEALNNLENERQKIILMYRYGFYNNKIYTCKELSKIFGVSLSRITQIENAGKDNLRKSFLINKYKENYNTKGI